MATQKDVAKLANVSFITVSRVINNMGNVKKETRYRVEKAIKNLNYYPNTIAQGLNSNRVKTLAVQAPLPLQASFEGTSYYRRILVGIEKLCIEEEYDVLISSQRDSDEKFDFLKPFYERKADGIAIIASKPNNSQLQRIIKENIPCVIIGDRVESIKLNYIDTENFLGMSNAAEYLISRGHKKIGYIKGNLDNQNAHDRFSGFLEAIKIEKLIVKDEWIFKGDFTKESGAHALNYYDSLIDKPTAIIASTDLMAIGFYEEAVKLKINIPDDFSLIGFDGHEICYYTNPRLTTMHQPLEEMGYVAAQLLINQIEKKSTQHQHLLYPVTLESGGSVKNLSGQ